MMKWVPVLLLLMGMAGCGQKGPLYFPDQASALSGTTPIIAGVNK